ncbi:MAG TPA: cytochrome c peroxidase [Gemmatimonadaceae bacterium]|nr:cytochrome c peroxidase [Gemmatimonadaceae bacterium]
MRLFDSRPPSSDMRDLRSVRIALFAVLALVTALFTWNRIAAARARSRVVDRPPTSSAVIGHYAAVLDTLDASLAALATALQRPDDGGATARDAFRRARRAYKRAEMYVDYYAPWAARELNGPPLPRTEDEDPDTPIPPMGFQMVEAELFPELAADGGTAARGYVRAMRAEVATLRGVGTDTLPGDAYVFDAMRQEIARVTTLGLAGFDVSETGDQLAEAAAALEGVRATAALYDASGAATARLDAAIARLRTGSDFDDFDRVDFIARFATPAARAVTALQRASGVAAPSKPRAWSARAASIWEENAFDPSFFMPPDAPPATRAMIELGRDIFSDAALSPAGRSCASCHLPPAFVDGRPKARLLGAHQEIGAAPARNTPALANAGLQPSVFYDSRVRFLEDQVTDVLGSSGEMGSSLEIALRQLRARPAYAAKFARATGRADSLVSANVVRYAVAAYVRSLMSLDSRFDRAVRGDANALTPEERHGFDVFMGKAKCGTCHFAPLFNGATPPTLTEAEPEVIGVPVDRARRSRVDPDPGRFAVRGIAQHRFAFKTPTLRNIALTAPYMHNGVFTTLEQVVDFYDGGGGAGRGIDLPNQTLPTDSLRLTKEEKRAVVAFMKALTDTSYLRR